jgi:hypothetical protein
MMFWVVTLDSDVHVTTQHDNPQGNILNPAAVRCWQTVVGFKPLPSLQEKRSVFPRFYFLCDDDLLEILGQSTKERVIQAHLKKLFAGIHSVGFDDDGQHIMAMKSLEGEVVQLSKHVKLTQQVEVGPHASVSVF